MQAIIQNIFAGAVTTFFLCILIFGTFVGLLSLLKYFEYEPSAKLHFSRKNLAAALTLPSFGLVAWFTYYIGSLMTGN